MALGALPSTIDTGRVATFGKPEPRYSRQQSTGSHWLDCRRIVKDTALMAGQAAGEELVKMVHAVFTADAVTAHVEAATA